MKKLIALLIAVSTLTMSTSALAYTDFDLYPTPKGGLIVDGVELDGGSRNYTLGSIDPVTQGPNYGSNVFRSTDASIANLPTYRSGDFITFAILPRNNGSTAKVNEGDILTFICSKRDDVDYDNYNVQFVDQTTLTPSPDRAYVYCTYKLRDNIEDGIYKLEMRLNGISKTYSFLIGTPTVELLYVNDVSEKDEITKADKYFLRNGSAYCFGKATITGGANFSQADTDFGFVFNGTYNDDFIKKTERRGNELIADAQNALQASLDNGNNQEIGGQAQYFFRMVITGVSDVNALPDVDVYLNE